MGPGEADIGGASVLDRRIYQLNGCTLSRYVSIKFNVLIGKEEMEL